MSLRKIEPLPLPAAERAAPDLGPKPTLLWVKPTDLLVDATYQRDLSRQSLTLIRKMAKELAWNRMKPPVVVMVDKGFHVVDGQHTAITAATIGIAEIPVFVVHAASVTDRARAFVGHNTDRITVSSIAIWRALLGAGDPEAVDVDSVCKRSGVRIRTMNQTVTPAEGDTMAVGVIHSLVRNRGALLARQVLECLVKARRAPIVAAEIRAAEILLCDQRVNGDDLSVVIRVDGNRALNIAHAVARETRCPIFRALADRWAERLRKAAA